MYIFQKQLLFFIQNTHERQSAWHDQKITKKQTCTQIDRKQSQKNKQEYIPIQQPSLFNHKDDILPQKQTQLDFSKQELTQISIQILENETVTYLNFSGNNISQLPKKNMLTKLRFLQTLNLSLNKFRTMVFPKMQSLRVLIVDSNSLHSLNVDNQSFLKILSCQNNQIDCLSIPLSLQILNARNNELHNLFFMCEIGSKKNCLQQVNIQSNKLYDIKLIPQQYRNSNRKINFPNLEKFYVSGNKIIHLDGFETISNVKQIDLSRNELSISRSNLNELLKLKSIQEINLMQNPLQEGGYDFSVVKNTLRSKIHKLRLINKEEVMELVQQQSAVAQIKQSPYKLFLDEQPKKQQEQKFESNSKPVKLKEWNFTLGDCEESDPSVNLDLLSSRNKQQFSPVLLIKTTDVHLNYTQYFRRLLPMSFVAPRPIKPNQIAIAVSMRLDPESDQHLIINEMMKQRGGVVYVRKIMIWKNNNLGHMDQAQQFGFYHEQIEQRQFKNISKGLVKKQFSKSFIGIQPNMFSCYHLLVRIGRNQTEYGCLYAIQTSHL